MIVYTVIANEYDDISPIEFESNCDFFIISDCDMEVPKGWKFRKIENIQNFTPVEYNRYYKMNGSLVFGEGNPTIYLDSNIELTSCPEPIFKYGKELDIDIGMYEHPARNDFYEELELIKKLGYCYFWQANKVGNRYKCSIGYQGFFEANIIYRNGTVEVSRMMSSWFEEFSKHIKRDQVSLNYISFKHAVKIKSFGLHDARNEKKYFNLKPHKNNKNAAFNIKAKVLNKLARMLGVDRGIK